MYKRFCQRSWIKMERERHYIWLLGISAWLMLRNSQCGSQGHAWRVSIMERNGIGKNEIAAKMGFDWNECSVIRGRCAAPETSVPIPLGFGCGESLRPFQGLCGLALWGSFICPLYHIKPEPRHLKQIPLLRRNQGTVGFVYILLYIYFQFIQLHLNFWHIVCFIGIDICHRQIGSSNLEILALGLGY